MSTPTRSPLALTGEFPDDEVLVADIVGSGLHAAGLLPGPERVDTDTSDFAPPAVTCYAPSGRSSVNRLGDVKSCFLYLDCLGADRAEAKAMAAAVEAALLPYERGGIWKNVQIHRITQVSSPTELPLRHTEDPRHRESGWTVLLRPHRGPAIYP